MAAPVNVIQPSVSTINLNIGLPNPPLIAVILTWDLRQHQTGAMLQITYDGVNYSDVNPLNGGGSHSVTIPLNSTYWYRAVLT